MASPKIVATCYDKRRAARFLIACGVGVPRTWVRVTPNVRASRCDSFAIVASGPLATVAT
ncbi:MAG TPA: hypothetical protein VK595_10475 [Vicinamibacterales bacterium]|nr:hypothetical protein [Vicinamibacterales bacterium]